MTPQWYVETLIWHGWNTCCHPSFAEMWAKVAGGSLFPRENEAGLVIMFVLYLLDQCCFAGVCSITFAFPCSRCLSLSVPPQDKYPQQIGQQQLHSGIHSRSWSFNRKQSRAWSGRKGWVEKEWECERDACHYEARLGDSERSHVLLLSPLDDPAPLCLHWEKGNGRRIYCWVLTCTHSWCCFSPLGPLAIPKASKTTGCQVVTAGFKQLLQQPCT